MKFNKIYNGTPHDINIVANAVFKPEIRKYVVPDGVDPVIVATIPSSRMLSAKVETVELPVANGEIPVFSKKIVGVDEIPDLSYDCIIVSALYASAYMKLYDDYERLYTVADPVYSEDGRTIIGSRGICPAF